MKRRPLPSLILLITAIANMLPFVFAVLNSFKSKAEILLSPIAIPRTWSLANYAEAIRQSNYLQSFSYSLLITAASVGLIVVLGAAAGYSIARSHPSHPVVGSALLVFFGLSMFVPFQTIMIPLLKTAMEFRMVGSVVGLVLIYGGMGCPLPIFLYQSYIRSIPRAVEESAVIDGCSNFQVFYHIILPLVRPVTGVVAVLQGLWIWNDFLLPYLILQKPLTIPLNQIYFYHSFNRDWNYIMAMFVLSVAPVVIFYFFVQRKIIAGMVAGAVKQ